MEPIAPITVMPSGYTITYDTTLTSSGMVSRPIVTQVLPGTVAALRAVGIHELTRRPVGTRGTLEVLCTVAAGAGDQVIAQLTDTPDNPGSGFFLAISAAKRFVAGVWDRFGANVASTMVTSGKVFTPGDVVKLTLAWDSTQPIFEGKYVAFGIDDEAFPEFDWSPDPLSTWVPVLPTHMVIGVALGGPFSDFTGVVQLATASDAVLIAEMVHLTALETPSAILGGGATLSAALSAVFTVEADAAGDATLSADLSVILAVEADAAGDASLTGEITIDCAADAALSSTATVTADLQIDP